MLIGVLFNTILYGVRQVLLYLHLSATDIKLQILVVQVRLVRKEGCTPLKRQLSHSYIIRHTRSSFIN